jgi:PKD repeat protein
MYLITPYNAYQKPPKKKHWHEIAEEEALFVKMMMEAKTMAEAKTAQMTVADSVQDGPSLATVTAGPAGGAGGGGTPPRSYFDATLFQVDFVGAPTLHAAQNLVTFTNLTVPPPSVNVTTWKWTFGDGTSSSLQNPPVHTYDTGSFDVKLEATNSFGQTSSLTRTAYISSSTPVLIADFSTPTLTGTVPLTVNFTSSTTYDGSGTLTYLWNFGDLTSSALPNPSHTYISASIRTVTLQVTESIYNQMSLKTRTNYISASA